MIRNLLGIVGLFLLPTAAYLVYALLARPTRPAREVVGGAPFIWLAVSGLALVLGTLTYYGATSSQGGVDEPHAPPRITDGQPEPGGAK